MATLEFNRKVLDEEYMYCLYYEPGGGLYSGRLTIEEAWAAYRDLQRVLVGTYSGRNGKYNGN
jgi:hypothetical protein